jgi:uncharacterized protein YjbI with pentapeptide repeats
VEPASNWQTAARTGRHTSHDRICVNDTPEPAPAQPSEAAPKAPRRRRRGILRGILGGEGRLDTFFVGFVLALVPGVAGTLWAISYLSDNISTLVNIALFAILVVSLFGTLLIVLQGRLFKWMGLRASTKLADVALPLHDVVKGAIEGDLDAAGDALRIAGERVASWYSWFSVRRWIIGISVALMAGFAALIGSALLHQQNSLIAAQNEFFRDQNQKITRQINATEQQHLTLRRSALISTLYDRKECERPPCAHVASSRSRAEAFRALVVLDRNASGAADWGKGEVDYTQVDLRWANLDGIELGGVRLRGADLRGASLIGANLAEADLRGAQFGAADLRDARLTGANVARADFSRANVQAATLDTDLSFVGSLEGARYNKGTVFEPGFKPAAAKLEARNGTIPCAACCAAFQAGAAAGSAYAGGKPTATELRELRLQLEPLGIRLSDGADDSTVGERSSAFALFEFDATAEQLWARTRRIASVLHLSDLDASDAFGVGLYTVYMELNATRARRFAVEELERLLPAMTGGALRADTAGIVAQMRVVTSGQASADQVPAILERYAQWIGQTLGCGD